MPPYLHRARWKGNRVGFGRRTSSPLFIIPPRFIRLENYHRPVRELAFEQEKAWIGLVRSEQKRWKGITKLAKEIKEGEWGF